MQLLAGTSGYSYKEWLGHFYPEKLPAADMLGYYAGRLPTVEINNTFYRMPAEATLAHWAEQVPAGFALSVKAPRRITHEKRLRDAGSDVAELVRRVAGLGDKLGLVLFQLPHFLKKDLPRLEDFLDALPPGTRAALDFRNDTWHDDTVHAALQKRGVSLCVTDGETGDTAFAVTTDCGYLRLRRAHYGEDELRAWAERIAAQRVPCTYVYFMHEDEALGTRFARVLNAAWRERGAAAT